MMSLPFKTLLVVGAVAAASVSPVMATEYKVILMGGQSNMDGHAPASTSNLPASLQQPQTDVLYSNGYSKSNAYYTGNATYTYGQITSLQPGASYFGPEITLGETLAKDNPGQNFILVKYAVAGSGISSWGASGGCYKPFKSTVDSALSQIRANGDTYDIVAMLWLQGEADATTDPAALNTYKANLTTVIGNVRAAYGADLPFVMGGIGETTTDGAASRAMDSAQAQLAASLTNVSFFSNEDLWSGVKSRTGQTLHFDTTGYETVGQRYAAQLESLGVVPEPASLGLIGAAAATGLLCRRRGSGVAAAS